jgi:hypothetical protein
VTGTADVKADVTFLVRVDQEALVEIHANGSSGGATELKKATNYLFLSWRGSAWRTIEISQS